MNINKSHKSYFNTSSDITKNYFGISAVEQVKQQKEQLQLQLEQKEKEIQEAQIYMTNQTTLNLYKQEVMNVMKEYIDQKINRIQTVDKLNDLHELVRAVTKTS